ncbi:MAG: type I 3-dehydroquinate dehydratase [Acidobacteriota bacterium]|nr:type I 3-dehydroquinate dehydratase [Acidobacteriota bacterium]
MVQSQVCVTVTATTTDQLRRQRDAAVEADLIELRLDGVKDLDVSGALQGRLKPAIVTCRSVQDGGSFDGGEEARRRIIAEALECGAEFVDIEWDGSPDSRIAAHKSRTVLSYHQFSELPKDLDDRYVAMRATGAAVVKIAVQAKTLMDLAPLVTLGQRARQKGERAVIVGMGAPGVASRILADRFGACWSYAGNAAPGQIAPDRLVREFRFRELSDSTEVYGVVGNPAMHSLSPAMHNAGFRAISKDAVYLPLEAADVDDFLNFADVFGISGASITSPFKEDVHSRVRDSDPMGKRIGAVNTLKKVEDSWKAMNSDVDGFLEPLLSRFTVDGWRATVVGAGGAARAASVALVDSGVLTTICARRQEQAEEAAKVSGAMVGAFPVEPGTWDLLVNATPIGTAPQTGESLLPASSLDGRLVYDLVYNPSCTRLLKEASQRGCRTLGGLEMLIAQAKRQFEWWTGSHPPGAVFETAAQSGLALTVE